MSQITLPQSFQSILLSSQASTKAECGGLEVVCVGLSRTGTASLKAALSIILPGNTYHAMDFLTNINTKVGSMLYYLLIAHSDGRSLSCSGAPWLTNLQPKTTFASFSSVVTTVVCVMCPACCTGGR